MSGELMNGSDCMHAQTTALLMDMKSLPAGIALKPATQRMKKSLEKMKPMHKKGHRMFEFAVEVAAGPATSFLRHTKVRLTPGRIAVEPQLCHCSRLTKRCPAQEHGLSADFGWILRLAAELAHHTPTNVNACAGDHSEGKICRGQPDRHAC